MTFNTTETEADTANANASGRREQQAPEETTGAPGTVGATALNREALKLAAAAYHEQGYNCAQAVICALAPTLGLDHDAAFRLAEGFGAGMGGMTETCGAVSGAVMALGQAQSAGADVRGSKGRTYKLARELTARFAEKNGTTVCRELKGVGSDRGPLRSCPGCIDDAIDLAVDILRDRAAA